VRTYNPLAPDLLPAFVADGDLPLKTHADSTITSSILVLQELVLSQPTDQANAQSTVGLVTRLASKLEGIKSPPARTCVLGLVGRFPGQGGLVGLEILRIGTRGFAQEVRSPRLPRARTLVMTMLTCSFLSASQQPEVKLALLTLATKLFALPDVQAPDQLRLLGRYLVLLARYDGSYDVRDRARFLRGLVRGLLDEGSADDEDAEDGMRDVGGVVLRQEQISLVVGGSHQPAAAPGSKRRTSLVRAVLPVLKLTIRLPSPVPVAEFGTTSALTQPHFLPGYTPLPDWKEEGADPTLRDPPPSLEAPAYTPSAPALAGPSQLKGFGSESVGAARGGLGGAGSNSRPQPASLPGSGRRGEVDLNKFYESSRCVERLLPSQLPFSRRLTLPPRSRQRGRGGRRRGRQRRVGRV
jgi:AP-3 complex subunit beta